MLTPDIRVAASDLRDAAFSSSIQIDSVKRVDKGGAGIVKVGQVDDARPTLTFELTEAEAHLLSSANSLSVQVDLPHVYNWSVGLVADVRPGRDHIGLAMRNCL